MSEVGTFMHLISISPLVVQENSPSLSRLHVIPMRLQGVALRNGEFPTVPGPTAANHSDPGPDTEPRPHSAPCGERGAHCLLPSDRRQKGGHSAVTCDFAQLSPTSPRFPIPTQGTHSDESPRMPASFQVSSHPHSALPTQFSPSRLG